MNHLSLIRLAAVALTLAVLTGCADLQEQLPPATTAGANVHPDGWNVPAASTFHGKHIRANGWEMTSCQQCHGALNSTNGGTSGVSCATCHSQPAGPNDCTTCHGGVNAAPPRDLDGTTTVTSPGVGAHQFHLASMTTGKLVQCAECHTVPAATADSGHIDASLPAEVPMNGAIVRTARSGVTPSPAYSFTNNTCGGTYCHGSFKNGNLTNAPTWNAPAGTGAACGTCHGNTAGGTTAQKALPKTAANGGTHPNYTQCSMCHDQVVNASTNFVDRTKHLDGINQVYPYGGSADCSHCHGSAANAAPPKDIAGNSSTSARGVGAHQVHLLATTAKQVKCAECHTVPATLDYSGADGHMEGTALAEVAMNDTLASVITTVGSTTTQIIPNPTYNPADQSCSNTYCHGTFDYGNPSNAPTWTNAASGNCGTCHGNPATGNPLPPPPHSTNQNCGICHTFSGEPPIATYNSVAGTWSITNAKRHINGKRNTFTTEGPY
jgi:predicted CxxxxCH...CXXCH cytochrome family protein